MERRVVRLFLASPSDVEDERAAAHKVVERVNQKVGRPLGAVVDLFGWEQVPPGYGRPQDLINPQIDECDVFVGIVGLRWGTPTGEYSSGFEEEFNRARQRRQTSGSKPELWLFLMEVPPERAEDPGPQLQRVLDFHKRVTDEAQLLYRRYDSVPSWREEFYDTLLDYLLTRYGRPAEQPLEEDDPLLAPPSGRQPLLIEPRPALLPIRELTPLDFERLLLDVAREIDGLRELHLYGVPGQRQHGLDVVGQDAEGRTHGYQAKRYEKFTARDLASTIDNYMNGRRKVARLVIGVAALAERTEILDELASQQAKHPDVEIELYDQRTLSDLLRDRPEIVRKFFGDPTAEQFCLPSRPEATPAAAPALDAVALADAVMRGPVEAAGVADVLAEADRRRVSQPEAAATRYARVEQALEARGFAAHALLVRRRRAAALRAAGRLDDAVGLLADSAWLYLDQGDVDEARMVLHELNQTITSQPSDGDR